MGGVNLPLLKDNQFGDTRFFILFSKRYYDNPGKKNKFLRFSTSDFFNIYFILKKVSIFEGLTNYIMKYLAIAWDNK